MITNERSAGTAPENQSEQPLKNWLIGFLLGYGYKLSMGATLEEITTALTELIAKSAKSEKAGEETALENAQTNAQPAGKKDYSKMTCSEAQRLFLACCGDIHMKGNCTFEQAFERAKLENPELFEKSMGHDGIEYPENYFKTALGNVSQLSPKPVFSPQLCLTFGLPADAYKDDEITDAVWRTTQGNATNIDWPMLFRVVAEIVGLRRNATGSAKMAFAAQDYPVLAERARKAEADAKNPKFG